MIEEANKGKIDLTGFEAFWNFITWKVDNEMAQSADILDISLPLCQQNLKSPMCSPCACSFRNDVISDVVNEINGIFDMAGQQAQDMFGEDVSQRVDDIFADRIDPWINENSCSESIYNNFPSTESGYCDFSQMTADFVKPSENIYVTCGYAFVCDEITFDGSSINLIMENVYFSKTTELNILAPSKARSGEDGLNPGEDGTDGEDGTKGADLEINAAVEL